ncbi:MAG TPA: zf-HC2 domain-containing protein, partial [Sandaracinaceae bacterium LLY-WYZ-13_1]|nr:zf-HC2 domain-containing protein [Sandaracinaceae bacterium LLY-WYZ-13_1]
MDCEACTDRMVELLYEELPDADAKAIRAHLDACETCAEAYDRLSTGQELASMLAFEEPPDAVRATVLEAARARAAELAPEAAPAPAEERHRAAEAREEPAADEDRGPWASLLHWIGGFAMRPQLAMAMTLVLMVGIGLWYLDAGRRHDPADTHAIVDPAPGDEVGPSASLEPAEPLDLEADPQTGRIRPRD